MLDDDGFRILLKRYGRSWKGYRRVRKGVMRRIRNHMRRLECGDLEEYLTIIEGNGKEYTILQSILQVTISRFFRDRKLWQNLSHITIPEMLQRFDGEVRVWCAGCACGEEPLSLAIIWQEMHGERGVEILATDSSEICLRRAQAGEYTAGSVREVPDQLLKRYFTEKREKDGYAYGIDLALCRSIRWMRHDFREIPPVNAIHLLFLRNNLLTYYDEPVLSTVFTTLCATLLPGGYLVTGTNEKNVPTPLTSTFSQVFPGIYRRKR